VEVKRAKCTRLLLPPPAEKVRAKVKVKVKSARLLPPLPGERVGVRGRVAIATLLALALSACGNIEPWVKPYERQQLADPIMSFEPHPISTSYTHHVFEAREGARGALGSAGGGCGCN
jgi:hypothetical protein